MVSSLAHNNYREGADGQRVSSQAAPLSSSWACPCFYCTVADGRSFALRSTACEGRSWIGPRDRERRNRVELSKRIPLACISPAEDMSFLTGSLIWPGGWLGWSAAQKIGVFGLSRLAPPSKTSLSPRRERERQREKRKEKTTKIAVDV